VWYTARINKKPFFLELAEIDKIRRTNKKKNEEPEI